MDMKITFSFEFYDLARSEYCLSRWEQDQIKRALERLKELNSNTFNELYGKASVLHFHQVDWAKTNEKHGFAGGRAEQFNDNAWQIALLSVNGQKTRMYGGYVNNVFYIVWFDLNHSIWPSYLKHT